MTKFTALPDYLANTPNYGRTNITQYQQLPGNYDPTKHQQNNHRSDCNMFLINK